jgi:apolipoprotein N-acyltransferase
LVRKLLALLLFVLVLAKILVFPRFRKWKERVDRAVNVTLFVLLVVYGFEMIRWFLAGK